MNQGVTGLFSDRVAAGTAIDRIRALGVKEKEVSILMSDSTRGKEFSVEVNSKAPEGAVAGAITGGTLGAIAAGLTAVGTIAVTGGVGIVAAGPVVAALAGGGAGAAAGGLLGALVGYGFDENEAKLVDEGVTKGSILVSVETASEFKDGIKEAFETAGAKKVTVH